MNTDKELMQQALEALTRIWEDGLENYPVWAHEAAIDNLRERLAQPEQEPFGYFRYDLRLDAWVQNREGRLGTPFYAAPPQRKPLPPQSPCEMTQAEGKMFKLGWLECEAAHGIGEKPDAA